MSYSVKTLRDKLVEKVLGLGITPKFKESPAFNSSLIEVDCLLAQMNMFSVADEVMVDEVDNKINFRWDSDHDVRYSFSLGFLSETSFNCVVEEEKSPSLSTSGDYVKERRIVEKVATLLDNGEMQLTTNGAIVKGGYNADKATNKVWVDRKLYNQKGVMREREFRTYPESTLNDNISNIKVDSMLYVPRGVFAQGFMSNNYDTRNFMVRNKIDTARVLVEDRTNKKKFMGEVPLSNSHGMKNMELNRDFDYPKEVLIKPLSVEEIEQLVKREKNAVVQDGLRDYAVGRDSYYYSSVEDSTFCCEVADEPAKKLG